MNSGRGEEPLQSRIVDDQRCVSVTWPVHLQWIKQRNSAQWHASSTQWCRKWVNMRQCKYDICHLVTVERLKAKLVSPGGNFFLVCKSACSGPFALSWLYKKQTLQIPAKRPKKLNQWSDQEKDSNKRIRKNISLRDRVSQRREDHSRVKSSTVHSKQILGVRTANEPKIYAPELPIKDTVNLI